MDDSTWRDGSDALQSKPTPPLYAKLKAQLSDALLTIEALDKASLAMLKHDTDYRQTIQRLLAPLTATPLSELVEEMMKSGLEAISSKMSALIPVPASISQIPAGPASGSSSSTALVQKPPPPRAASTVGAAVNLGTSISTTPATRMQQLETLVKGIQDRSSEALQQVIDESQGGLLLIWLSLHFSKWEETFDTKQLVQEINCNITELQWTSHGQQPTVSSCIDAWMSADRARIVLFTHSSTKAAVVSAIGKIVPRLTSDTNSWLSIRSDNQIKSDSSFL